MKSFHFSCHFSCHFFCSGFLFLITSANFVDAGNLKSPSFDTVSLHAFYLQDVASQERIPAWSAQVKLTKSCDWSVKHDSKSLPPQKSSAEECAEITKLAAGLKGENPKTVPESSQPKSASLLNYEIEYQGSKYPVSFQAPQRCKIDSQGNEVDCVEYKLSNAQKLLNIMRLKGPKSRHF